MLDWIIDFLSNPFLITAVISWLLAQTLKVITHAMVYHEFDIKRFFGDGGMPSAHTATVSSLAFLAGIIYGFGSFNFAICAIFTVVVCRDAVGVRMETGKQAVILNEIRKNYENESIEEIKLKEFVGHTTSQVMGGMILGIIVATVMYFILF